MMIVQNPIAPFLKQQGTFILDGGLATELEALGCDLQHELWSARLLLENPAIIQQVHEAYFRAGADCAITASYQASLPGLMQQGLTMAAAESLLLLSVQLAMAARDQFWADEAVRNGRLRPLVAASVGPYGAALANGAEYTGDYDLDEKGLVAWHRQRWHLLANSGADLLACETIPAVSEARAYHCLLAETPAVPAWLSFTCKDEIHISDGTRLADCVRLFAGMHQVVAIGINCTAPRYIPALIRAIQSVSQKPIVVYPNSGERYDAVTRRWYGEAPPTAFGTYSREWRKMGAALIGGCCRTRPAHIQEISVRLRRPAV